MPSQEISITDGGGIKITVTDDSGVERWVVLEPNDDGTIDIHGRGPDGESGRGTIAPERGNTSLGQ